jgi:threonine dehydrogenase-like Zn-dependent dehydrogenase
MIEPGALLVETTAATVCATDAHRWRGQVDSADARAELPLILGHEMVGRVVRIGDGAQQDSLGQVVHIGDRVVWTHGFCGRCRACTLEHQPTLCHHRRGYMASPCTEFPFVTGGFSEYCYVFPSSGRVKVPDDIPDDIASASSCALRTVVHGFERLGPVGVTDSVLVQGSGPLGLFTVAMATSSGAGKIIVIGGPAERLELARRWGADHTIDITGIADHPARLTQVMDMTSGRGADVVIEVSGSPAAFAEGLDLIRRGGRYLVMGQIHGQSLPFNASSIVLKQANVLGSLSASVDHYYTALQFLRRHAHRYQWTDMISNHYSLNDVPAALLSMATHREIKPAITFGT